MEKLKYSLILIVPLIVLLYTYILAGALYNYFRDYKFKANYDDVVKYIKVEDELEVEILTTSAYRTIFNSVFEKSIDCSLFNNECKSSKDILSIIDNNLDYLYSEVNYHEKNKDVVRTTTFIMTKEFYDDNRFDVNDKIYYLDEIFEINSIKSAMHICLILCFVSMILSINWTKYSGVALVISSTVCMLFLLLLKLLSFFIKNSGTNIILSVYIDKISNLTLDKCYYFLVIGCFFILTNIIYNKVINIMAKKA